MEAKKFLEAHLLKCLQGAITNESSPSIIEIDLDGLEI